MGAVASVSKLAPKSAVLKKAKSKANLHGSNQHPALAPGNGNQDSPTRALPKLKGEARGSVSSDSPISRTNSVGSSGGPSQPPPHPKLRQFHSSTLPSTPRPDSEKPVPPLAPKQPTITPATLQPENPPGWAIPKNQPTHLAPLDHQHHPPNLAPSSRSPLPRLQAPSESKDSIFLSSLATEKIDVVTLFSKSFKDVLGMEPADQDEFQSLQPEILESIAQHHGMLVLRKMRETAAAMKVSAAPSFKADSPELDTPASTEKAVRLAQFNRTTSFKATLSEYLGAQAMAQPSAESAEKVQEGGERGNGGDAPGMPAQTGKFAVQGDFADVTAYYQGLEAAIGLPHPSVFSAMQREHLSHPAADDEFETLNYDHVQTTIRKEWEIVLDPDPEKEYPGGRRLRPLEEFLEHEQAKEADLTYAEVVALRLFTGPMYMYYNSTLRSAAKFKGNVPQFATTIHAISSGIVKLMRVWKLPTDRKVYRGMSGMVLPSKFFNRDHYGCRGGVELSFMSTSTRKEVALQYSRQGDGAYPTLFEIDVGQIDRGAPLKWISQFPDEEEILLPPLSNLEVFKDPEVQIIGEAESAQRILVVQLRLNINSKLLTIEEIRRRRTDHHLSLVRNLMQETKQKCLEMTRSYNVHLGDADYVERYMGDLDKYYQECLQYPDHYLSEDDDTFREATNTALNHKVGTIRKFETIVRWQREQEDAAKGKKIRSRILEAQSRQSFMNHVFATPSIDFCNPGLLYRLRAGTEEIPWSAIVENTTQEVFLPTHFEETQASVVWDCIIDYNVKIPTVKVEVLEGKLASFGTEAILNNEDQSWGAVGLGSSAIKLLSPGWLANDSITKLDLSNAQIMDAGCEHLGPVLSHCGDNLQILNLCYNSLSWKGLFILQEHLVGHSSLTQLNLAVNPALDWQASATIASIFNHHRGVKDLDLSWTHLGQGCAELAKGLQLLDNLVVVDFTSVFLGSEGMAAIARALHGKRHLKQAFFGACKCQDSGAFQLNESMKTWPNMTVLPMVGWGSTSQANQLIAQTFAQWQELKVFVVRDQELDDETAIKFARSLKNMDLAVVDIGNLQLGAQGNSAILEIATKTSITSLMMQQVSFACFETQKHFREIEFGPMLKQLDFSGTNFGDIGVANLSKALQHTSQLTKLNFNRSLIGLAGVIGLGPVIQANTNLEHLMLGTTCLRDEGASALAEVLEQSHKLQNLHLQSNDIGSPGLLRLGAQLSALTSLRMLNLRSNSFGLLLMEDWSRFRSFIQNLKNLRIVDVQDCDCPPIAFRRVAQMLSASGGAITLGV